MSTNSKVVRMDKDMLDTLAEKRVGFETPNECLKRLLNGKSRPCTAAEVVEVEDVETS